MEDELKILVGNALRKLRPGSLWGVRPNGEIVEYQDSQGRPMPTKEEIDQALIEVRWDEIRRERTSLLARCDWVVTRSVELGEAVPENWKQYRQALRDITATFENPEDVVWPDRPE